MKNTSTLKSNISQSPKTPGGISKSLLTPCRRVGLSRNWKKNGPSPFISPLASGGEVKQETLETRKRKERILDEDIQSTPETVDENNQKDTSSTVNNRTPSRSVELPRRKKSKTLLKAITTSQDDIGAQSTTDSEKCMEGKSVEPSTDGCEPECIDVVSTPVRTKSKRSKKATSPKNNCNLKETQINSLSELQKNNEIKENITEGKLTSLNDKPMCEKSPNDLKRECVVVIQKKVFKNVVNSMTNEVISHIKHAESKNKGSSSQTLFDSDSDEVPLSHLNKYDPSEPIVVEDDDDFIEKKTTKLVKSENIITKCPKTKLKKAKIEKTNEIKHVKEPKPSSQCSYDADDDDFESKNTILIRKTYEKVIKPQKAKSTGSITQKDIDDLKARIKMKQKLLLAQSLTPDTAELRGLIKRWQKGCQDALMELLELMKGKFPDKQNMDYSEMLKALKIPASLVGYDSDNDCFVSPNDEDIILGQFKES